MPKPPLSRKWNRVVLLKVKRFLKLAQSRAYNSKIAIPNGMTMPDINSINIACAKRMDAAILFFDLEDFTSISASIDMERTLELLNYIIPSVMCIIRHWGGFFEKNTGDGVMAILGTETNDLEIIAKDAIECAMAIRYVMKYEIQPMLVTAGLPNVNFRVGIDMGTVLIGRIGVPNHNFLSAVGTVANIANKLQSLARSNGICIGESLARFLHPYLQRFCEVGDDPNWNWQYNQTGQSYHYYHFNHDWPEPAMWEKGGFFRQPRM